MSVVGALVGAQAARQRQEDTALLDAFRVAGATAPDRAQSLARLGIDPGQAFGRLASAGVLRSADRGRYYLDEAAVVARRTGGRRPSVRVLLAIVLLLLVGTVALGVLVAR